MKSTGPCADDGTVYDSGMVTSGMIVLAIGSAIGTTAAALRYPHLFHPDQGKGGHGADTSADRLRLRRQDPRDRNIIDR